MIAVACIHHHMIVQIYTVHQLECGYTLCNTKSRDSYRFALYRAQSQSFILRQSKEDSTGLSLFYTYQQLYMIGNYENTSCNKTHMIQRKPLFDWRCHLVIYLAENSKDRPEDYKEVPLSLNGYQTHQQHRITCFQSDRCSWKDWK